MTTKTAKSDRPRGRPRMYAQGSTRVDIYIPPDVLRKWQAAGGTDIRADMLAAFTAGLTLSVTT